MPSAWQIRKPAVAMDWRTTDGINNLYLSKTTPKPNPGPKSALVRIKAAALNARDMMVVAHDPIYTITAMPDLVPCADGAGVIEEVGEGSVWKVGEKVLISPSSWITGEVPMIEDCQGKGSGIVQGTLQDYLVVEDNLIIRAPPHLSYEEMAALPACGGTAVNALWFGPMPLQKGMTVLTQGTGGVSCSAIQLAAAAGATVIATSSSDAKLQVARSLGATHVINYRTTSNWAAEVLRITNGRGVDHVLDVGGAGTIVQSLQSVRHGGLVSIIGFLTPSTKTDLIPQILFNAKSIRGVLQASVEMVEMAARMYEEGGMKPAIAKVHDWDKARDAFRQLNAQSAVGKIVIKVGDE